MLISFPKINRPNWQILCSLYIGYVYVLSGKLGEGLGSLGPSPPWLRYWIHTASRTIERKMSTLWSMATGTFYYDLSCVVLWRAVDVIQFLCNINKKFELMLTRRAKAYSSSGLRYVNIQIPKSLPG